MSTLANNEDPDEAAFHKELRCLLRQKRSLKEIDTFLGIITCDPSVTLYNEPVKGEQFARQSVMAYDERASFFFL